jgi:hypothetical protein
MQEAIADETLGRSKGQAAKDLLLDLRSRQVAPVALVARSASNRQNVAQWLEREDLDYPVLLPATLGEGAFFEHLICTAWPNSSVQPDCPPIRRTGGITGCLSVRMPLA